MILGILPGISIPPLINNPINIAFMVASFMELLISAAHKVALSRTADTMFIQYKS